MSFSYQIKSSSVPLNIDSPLPLTKTHVPCKRLGCIQIAKGLLAALVVGAVLTGCGGSSSSSSSAPPQYKVSAALSNVATSGLKLHLDASGEFQNIDVKSGQTSISLDSLSEGKTYTVSVIQHPEGQHCSIQNARGTMSKVDVSNIAVTCETLQTYKLSAKVANLVGSGLQLQLASPNAGVNRDPEALSITPNGNSSTDASFSTALPTGSIYSVSIARQPDGQNCSVTHSYGKIGKADVSDVFVTCTNLPANTYKVSVAIHKDSFLPLSDLKLQLNGGNDLTPQLGLNTSSTVTFASSLNAGNFYELTISKKPQDFTCNFTDIQSETIMGTVGSTDVSATIACKRNLPPTVPYTVSALVQGLTGTGLQLQLVSMDGFKKPELSPEVTPDTTNPTAPSTKVTFTTALYSGNLYEVSVAQQPLGQDCQPTHNHHGRVRNANVSDIVFTCTNLPANTYTVNASVSKDSFKELTGLVLELHDTSSTQVLLGTKSISMGLTPSTQVSFTPPVNAGNYSVVISQQPSTGQICKPASSHVTINNADANVEIECATPTYTVEAKVSGLTTLTTATHLVLKLESPSGTEFLPVTANQ